MKIHMALCCSVLAGIGAAASACQPQVVPTSPPRADVIVLVPHPEDGGVGSATVSTPQGNVDLTTTTHATRVVAGQAPSVPAPMAEQEIQQRFGAAMAARPLPPGQFILYFPTGEDTVAPGSEALVAEIVEFVRRRPAADVSIIGHTDTVGEASSNITLGMRRAVYIRDILVKSGLDPSLADIVSHGEVDLLVRTPDNTPEAKNRRAEVTVR